jgi:NADP-dependent 3-hydroxy acid dehydrogenase YdfG
MTKALIPKLIASADGHVINVISIAGSEVYDNGAGEHACDFSEPFLGFPYHGAGYTSSKHAQRALSETMRLEFHGKPVRVTDVSPGAVETEFSVVRFAGDAQAAKKVHFPSSAPLSRTHSVARCMMDLPHSLPMMLPK